MSLLQLFWDFASADPKKQIQSSIELIKTLKPPEKLVVDSVAEFEHNTTQEYQYCLKRLLKGLSSSRQDSRKDVLFSLINAFKILDHKEFILSRIFLYKAILDSQTAILPHQACKIKDALLEYSKKEQLKTVCMALYIQLGISDDFSFPQNDLEFIWFCLATQSDMTTFGWAAVQITHQLNLEKLYEILDTSTNYNPLVLHPLYPHLLSIINRQEFWAHCQSTFNSSSHEKKFIGFEIFKVLCLSGVDGLFMNEFKRCLINSLSNKQSLLYLQAKSVLSLLTKLSKRDSKKCLSIVLELQETSKIFDQVTKTKTVQTLLSLLDKDAINQYIDHLLTLDHKLVINQFYLLVRTGGVVREQSWMLRIIDIFIQRGWSHGTIEEDNTVKDDVKAMQSDYRDKLISSLAYFKGKLGSGELWPQYIFNQLKVYVQTLPKDTQVLLLKTYTLIVPAQNKEQEAFNLLFYQLGINVFVNQDPTTLSELIECHSRINSKKRKADELDPVTVLTDILVSFLAQNSSVMRSLAVDVFKVFVPKCGDGVLELLAGVLGESGGVAGANELFEDDTGALDQTNSDADSDLDDDTEEEEGRNMTEVDKELLAKVEDAMKNTVPDETELPDLGDEDMEGFDQKLGEIFAQRKSVKKKSKETKNSVLHFKLRVLDLFEIYVQTNGSVTETVGLWMASNSQEEKVLHDRYTAILKKLKPKGDLETLQNLIDIARKTGDSTSFSLISKVCSTLSAKLDNSSVLTLYKAAYIEMMTTHSKIKPKLFEDVIDFLGMDLVATMTIYTTAKPFLLLKVSSMLAKIAKSHMESQAEIDGFLQIVLKGDVKLCKGVLKAFVGVGRKVKGWRFLEGLDSLVERYPELHVLVKQVKKAFE